MLNSNVPNLTNYGFSLTASEVEGLLNDKSPAALVQVTHKIAEAYSDNLLRDTDTKAAEQIFRLLVRETEVHVRATLANSVKNSTDIPKDIVLALAHDVAEVSLPILQYSEVLNDADLTDIIAATDDITRYVAISKRYRVSETLSGTLLGKGNDSVANALIANNGAAISESQMIGIVSDYTENKDLMKRLSQRHQLPVAVVDKLAHVVAGTIGQELKKKYALPDKEIEVEVDKARESETLKLLRFDTSPEELDKLIAQLIAFDRLTPSLILSAVCQGNFQFFETALARLSNIPVANARTLIKDRGDLGFRAIYNKSGLPESLFQAVRLLLKVVHKLDDEGLKAGQGRYANRIIEEVLHMAEANQVENLSYIVALVRRSAQNA